jgi:pimeloyl-ACP methyl ester carboxylesterase
VAGFIAPDHRGHGRGLRSEETFTLEDCADDAAALVRQLVPGRRVFAVGYSMGGPIALRLTERHADLVAGVVLEATSLEFSSTWTERMNWRLLRLFERVIRSRRMRRVNARIVRVAIEDNPALAPHRSWLAAEMRRGDPAAIVEAGQALRRFDARPLASSLKVPVAVVVTTGDHLVTPRKQRAMAKALHATVIEVEGDHDAFWARGPSFSSATVQALQAVISAASAGVSLGVDGLAG